MVSASSSAPSVILLGTGEVLSRTATLLGPDRCVLTFRSEEKCARARQAGWHAEPISLPDSEGLSRLIGRYPSVVTLVDSTPPSPAAPLDGAAAVLQAICGSAVQRLVYLSTTGVFGGTDGSWVDEHSPPDPRSGSAEARLEVEQLYRKSGMDLSVARISALYGPGTGLGMSLTSGRYTLRGDPRRWSNRVHLDDAARTILALINHTGTALPLVCLSDGAPAAIADVIEYYCSKFSLPYPPSGPPLESSWYAFERLNQRVSNKFMRELLGDNLIFPSFREGAATEFNPPFVIPKVRDVS